MRNKLDVVIKSSSPAASQLPSSPSPTTSLSANASYRDKVEQSFRGAIRESIPEAKQYVRDQYQHMISYHGTSKDGKRSMQQIGMRIAAKTEGATAAMKKEYDEAGEVLSEEFIERASQANYVSRIKSVSMGYAKTNRPLEDAAVVRVLAPDWKELGLVRDHDSGDSDAAAKTNKDIGKGFILQSKNNGDRSLTKEAYKQIHAELTRKFPMAAPFISLDEIAELIHEVQTDSEGEIEQEDWANAIPRS
ncbi:hypothetical protein [Massilia sp. BJB1822]|uniref:hypothetical protein n=1 Tax=Massilia sp. BJB1822 TaxID=2744470 RepID=UPI001594A320|nr:hypothetical protein [Massilia sp. BJB1822]NVE00123.1 hypothetical protein [Massilia sp. BJB1822]